MSLTVAESAAGIAGRIVVVRGQRVLLDTDLAALFGVTTSSFNQSVRRNRRRFPLDFMFRVTTAEWASLRSQFVILDRGRGQYRKYAPVAFTEHGALMAATILNSPRAVEMTVYIVRAFVKLREILSTNADLAQKLAELEKSIATLDARSRRQFAEVYSAIRALMTQPERPSKPIGFTAPIR
jgi:phage regulator Rha-like protein